MKSCRGIISENGRSQAEAGIFGTEGPERTGNGKNSESVPGVAKGCIPARTTYDGRMEIRPANIPEKPRSSASPRHSRGGETLAAAVVGSLIVAIAVGGIASIMASNAELEDAYLKNNAAFLLQNNAAAIVRRLDTSRLNEGEAFYLKKDVTSKNFLVLTGSQNSDYQYVNAMGEWVNTGTTQETAYSRWFLLERKNPSFGSGGGEIVRTSVKELVRR